MTGKYDDIIDMPHHVSETRPQMPMKNRTAQSMTFVALNGYKGEIEETVRLTEEKAELSEDQETILDMKQQMLQEIISEEPVVTVTYFVPDARESGGPYVTVTGALRRFDEYERVMILADNTRIPFDDVMDIESEQFNGMMAGCSNSVED